MLTLLEVQDKLNLLEKETNDFSIFSQACRLVIQNHIKNRAKYSGANDTITCGSEVVNLTLSKYDPQTTSVALAASLAVIMAQYVPIGSEEILLDLMLEKIEYTFIEARNKALDEMFPEVPESKKNNIRLALFTRVMKIMEKRSKTESDKR